jgi:predicted hotdog family 3-hydroxylacyl-ACP dehydratase
MSTDLNVDDLVPHRGTMSWLDRVISVDAESVVAESDLKDTSFFMQGGQMPAWIGIEYMAQTIAAWAGQRARNEGRAIALGFLVGTRRYEVTRQSFKLGDRLRIEATCELMAGNGLGMFACRLLVGDDVVASANLSVFEPPDGAAFLEESQKGEP